MSGIESYDDESSARVMGIILMDIADRLDREPSPWDGESVSGEEAYRTALQTVTTALRATAQTSIRKMIPSGK